MEIPCKEDQVQNTLYGGDPDSGNPGDTNDLLLGGDGNDILNGGPGDDDLRGGNNSDTLTGDAGTDTLNCGPGGTDTATDDGVDVISANCENIV